MKRCLAVLCIGIGWNFENPVLQCSQKTYSSINLQNSVNGLGLTQDFFSSSSYPTQTVGNR
jgi:hypothetical protein